MTNARLRKEKRIFADKKKVLAVLNMVEVMTFSEIVEQLPISSSRIKGLLIALLKSNDVFHNDGVWSVHKKPTRARKQEPLYPDFDKDHEEWQRQVLAKKPQFNPFGK